MLSNRQLFYEHVAQTSTDSLGLEIASAQGIFLHATDGKKYIDLVSGVSVSNVGHAHPEVVRAVQEQAEKHMMNQLTYNPALGHITTFGGHPVSCAAALASLKVILREQLTRRAIEVGDIFRQKMKHPRIKGMRGKGLFLAVELDDVFIPGFMKFAAENGIIFDPFLFNADAFRIAPPLIISNEQAGEIAHKLVFLIDEFVKKAK